MLYVIFLLGILLLGYFVPRDNFYLLLGTYAAVFLCFYFLCRSHQRSDFYLGLTARAMLLFSVPAFSDDYFRFLWDGLLISKGLSPFLHLPAQVLGQLSELGNKDLVHDLFNHMNSKDYYSVYPPINQWVFWLAASFSSVAWGVFVLKCTILLGVLGVYWVLKKLTFRFSLSPKRISYYWLNPLVIIELCGNAHFDGLMVMFFLMATFSFAKMKDKEGALYFAFAALSKLFSLMFFPLVLLKSSWNRKVKILLMVLLVLVLCYIPFLKYTEIKHMGSSFDLYFQRFEFNASIYYLFRYFGTLLVGYNPIATVGPILAASSTLLILMVSYLYRFRNRLAMYTGFLLINTVYLFFSPIVHPWYLAMLVALSVLTKYRFALVWSGMIVLSYWAYGNKNFHENQFLIFLEYFVVLVFLYLDLRKHFTIRKLKAGFGF